MSQPDSIVFFDGICNFCNGIVNWLIARNNKGNLKFASLQGSTAERLLPIEVMNDFSSIVYYRKGRSYLKSTAALYIISDLAWYGFLAMPFMLVPRFFRDGIYNWVARNRYRWFGRREVCRIPTTEERTRFLD
jgi:predicted DCC family thiol-disulfide oxidoreductase YuxK